MKLSVEINESVKYQIESIGNRLLINGKEQTYSIDKIDENSFLLKSNLRSFHIYVLSKKGGHLELSINGYVAQVDLKTPIHETLEQLGMDLDNEQPTELIVAPMPGTILSVNVKEFTEVKQGDSLLILEAMKMENLIKSPSDGIIQKIHVKKGMNVEKNQVLISF